MFDVSWSELLIVGIVALIVVGPKDLPRFLNTLGRYAGMVRRQANEFRSVFEQAMREAEMDEIQKEVRAVSEGVKASLDDATRSVESVKAAAETKIDTEAIDTETGAEAAPKAVEGPARDDAKPADGVAEAGAPALAADPPASSGSSETAETNSKAGAGAA